MTIKLEKALHSTYSTQVNLMSPLKDKVLQFSKLILKDCIEYEFSPHITILYGIKNLNSRDKIEYSTFSGMLGQIKKFSQPDKDVIYVEVFSEELKNKHFEIKDTVAVDLTYPKYTPHLTLGYCKKYSNDNLLNSDAFYGERFFDLPILFCGKNEKKWLLENKEIN